MNLIAKFNVKDHVKMVISTQHYAMKIQMSSNVKFMSSKRSQNVATCRKWPVGMILYSTFVPNPVKKSKSVDTPVQINVVSAAL